MHLHLTTSTISALVAGVMLWLVGSDRVMAQDAHCRATLVTGVESIEPGVPFLAAVSFEMEEGWHIYWRNPGDAGLATSIAWNLPNGFTVDPLGWPVPHLFGEPPEVTYGYSGSVVLPVRITPPSRLVPGSRIELSARVDWLVCRDACVPGRATVAAQLPVEASHRDNVAAMKQIEHAVASAPAPVRPSFMTAMASEEGYTIRIADRNGSPGASPTFLPYFESVIDHSAAQRVEKVTGATLIHLAASPFATGRAARLQGILVQMDGSHPADGTRALEVDLEVESSGGTP